MGISITHLVDYKMVKRCWNCKTICLKNIFHEDNTKEVGMQR